MTTPQAQKIGNISIGGGGPLLLIAGPCVIESKDLLDEVAGKMKEVTETFKLPYVFKASFDKANRTSLHGC